MSRRTPTGRRINDQIIEELRARITNGIPWVPPEGACRGYGDLIFLVTGLYYPIAADFIHDKDDLETITELWGELRQDILDQHIKRKPGTRPWAWWREDREQRRVIRIDKKMLSCNEGRVYESEREYLERFGLLTKQEAGITEICARAVVIR